MALNLEILKCEQVTQAYVDWYLNDEIVRFSDNQYRTFSLEGQRAYVSSCLEDPNLDLYGIFDGDRHIGNILIAGLTSVHKRGELTYVIGDQDYWGRGVGSFAVSKMVEYGQGRYGLNKLYAGLARGNIGSARVLEKNGFVLEGVRKKHLFYGGEYVDQLDYGLVF